MMMLLPNGPLAAQVDGIDPEALITAIVAAETRQREAIQDITFDAELVEGERDDDGRLKEKMRFEKTVYLMYAEDTTFFSEVYLRAFKDGEELDSAKTAEQVRERREKKKKRGGRDLSWTVLHPFYPENRALYKIEYVGLVDGYLDDLVCHRFLVTAKDKDPELINGDYYFETEAFNLARVDLSPAKLTSGLMFKLHRLDMTLIYGPTPEGYWLPRRFDVTGKGKAALFIGVKFAGTEYYRNPRINTGLNAKLFEVEDDK
jgi:hypothetical protein